MDNDINVWVKTKDGQIGIVWFSDCETSEDFENINYAFTPEDEIYKECWSNTCQWLRREDFEIIQF